MSLFIYIDIILAIVNAKELKTEELLPNSTESKWNYLSVHVIFCQML